MDLDPPQAPGDGGDALALRDLLPEAGDWPREPGETTWESHRAERETGTLLLRSERRRSDDGDEWRWMRLTGPKVDVQTLFVYPPAQRAGPLLAAEVVTLGARTIVAVIDAPVLGGQAADAEPVRSDMLAARSRRALVDPASLPPWYEACRSGYDIFLRPQQAGQLAAFWAAAAEVGARWGTWRAEARELGPDAALRHAVRLATYRVHHRENSPGVPILTRLFGDAWTQGFMEHFF